MKKKPKHFLPNIITLTNMFLGFVAIGLTIKNQPLKAGVAIMIAGILDVFEAGQDPQDTVSWWESSMKVGIKSRSTSEDVKEGAVFSVLPTHSVKIVVRVISLKIKQHWFDEILCVS